ncbi:MAG TPA: hypothetical protein VLO13_00760, partial [Halomonas sp.]|nr:hypothetical protein [Halomonas sp.]
MLPFDIFTIAQKYLGKHPPLLLNLCLLKNFSASAFVAKRPRIIRVSSNLASTFFHFLCQLVANKSISKNCCCLPLTRVLSRQGRALCHSNFTLQAFYQNFVEKLALDEFVPGFSGKYYLSIVAYSLDCLP